MISCFSHHRWDVINSILVSKIYNDWNFRWLFTWLLLVAVAVIIAEVCLCQHGRYGHLLWDWTASEWRLCLQWSRHQVRLAETLLAFTWHLIQHLAANAVSFTAVIYLILCRAGSSEKNMHRNMCIECLINNLLMLCAVVWATGRVSGL